MNYILYAGTCGNELQNILSEVCDFLNVRDEEAKGKCRKTEFVVARVVYCEAARCFTDASQIEIGALINRDRTTVLHSFKSSKNMYKYGKQSESFKKYYTQKK